MTAVSSRVLPACWSTILDNVQKALAQAESEAARAAAAIDGALGAELTVGGHNAVWQAGVDNLDEKIGRLEECAAKASQIVAETEVALASSEAALRQWLSLAEAMRRKLATQAVNSV